MMIDVAQLNALNRFALTYGRNWRTRLRTHWERDARPPLRTPDADIALLRQVRNQAPNLLFEFKPLPTGYAQVGYLKKDHQERYNLTRGWYVTAWRIVDANGDDLVQPWSGTKTEARETAEQLRIYLLAEKS